MIKCLLHYRIKSPKYLLGRIKDMDYPVTSTQEGIKIRPEKMETDKLYHCIFNDKVMLFFKDHNDMLNCYEIDEKELVNSVKQSTSSLEIETILQKFAEKENLNH